MLERILGDIHGILLAIVLTILTLLYWVPHIFLDNNEEDEPEDDNS